MNIIIYVNGKIVLISKLLPKIKFRELDTHKELQEGVPFNISLGGGTQGLSEVINFTNIEKNYLLPIEKHFAGTFIGELSKFKMYNEAMTYDKILNNTIFNNDVYTESVTMSRYQRIYYGYGDDILNFNDFIEILNLENEVREDKEEVKQIIIDTGTENRVFVFAVPDHKLVEDITVETPLGTLSLMNYYQETTIQVKENITYKIYVMTNAIPYSGNNEHKIIFK